MYFATLLYPVFDVLSLYQRSPMTNFMISLMITLFPSLSRQLFSTTSASSIVITSPMLVKYRINAGRLTSPGLQREFKKIENDKMKSCQILIDQAKKKYFHFIVLTQISYFTCFTLPMFRERLAIRQIKFLPNYLPLRYDINAFRLSTNVQRDVSFFFLLSRK